MHAGLGDAARHGKRPQSLAPVPALTGEPRSAFLEDLAHPVERFHVVLERRPAEEPDLRDVRRTQPRHSALAFDRLDHRGLFAADVRARAAAQVNAGQRARRIGLQRGDLAGEDRAAGGILVAQVDVDVVDADRPGRDQHPFEKPVRIALEVVAILERAGLAFVDVDRHQPRRRFGADDLPLAADRKSRAAQAAQARILHRLDDLVERALAAHAGEVRRVSIRGAVRVVVDVGGRRRLGLPVRDGRHDRFGGCAIDRIASDHGRGSVLAATDARRAEDAHFRPAGSGERLVQRFRSGHPAGQRLAYAHRQRRGRGLALLHDVEVVIERRDLVDLRHRERHLLRESHHVRGGDAVRTYPGSGAGTRSGGRAAAARRRAARGLPPAPSDRRDAL